MDNTFPLTKEMKYCEADGDGYACNDCPLTLSEKCAKRRENEIAALQKLVMKLAETVRFREQNEWMDILDTDEVTTRGVDEIINQAKKELGMEVE